MYFPYFRGRQYELLALKELAQKNLLGKSVVPVVEPIKLSSTFNGSLQAYRDAELPFALILNPDVGALAGNSDPSNLFASIAGSIIPSILLNNTAGQALDNLTERAIPADSVLTILTSRDHLNAYRDLFSQFPPKYTLFPDERQIRRTVSQNKVLFEDRFIKQERNSNYLKQEDEFFSDDHLFFKEEGYVGFGDYSIVGNEYIESGFAPYAVAIHIVYFDSDDTLRIHHFVSDSNDDISDVAGKFHEAVSKLAMWYSKGQKSQLTSALATLLDHNETGYYPGLPTIKKLSIMHHLELMGKYLDGGFW